MSLLTSEPPEPMRSLDELFAMAQALEAEAAARYAELADRMRAISLAEVGAVFDRLAAEERGHAEHVEGWAQAATGAAPDPARVRWQPPETFDEAEARALGSSSLATAYRALSMAVRNEERAFALWTYIAAQAEDPTIQAAAERMAREELAHAAMLRRERRRAFHAERHGATVAAAARLPPAEEAARVERALAARLSRLAESVARTDLAAELRRLAEAATLAARDSPGDSDAKPEQVSGGMHEVLRLGERSVELHLDAADAAREEAAMRHFQALAEQAIARIALLRRIAGEG